MKKVIYLFAVLVLLAACKNKDRFEVTGQVENAGGIKKVMLYQNSQLLDSAILNENNEFKFTRVAPNPDFYDLVVGEHSATFVAQNGDEITFKFDLANPERSYEVEGTEVNEKLKAFSDLSAKYTKVFVDIQNEFQSKVSANPSLQDSLTKVLTPRFEENLAAYSKATLDFGKENEDNLAGFYAMGTLDQVKYEQDLINYAERVKGKLPNISGVELFFKRIEAVKPVSIGQIAPVFEMPGADGRVVRLSDFRGKYVLVDFWASWCGPCRRENPNLVRTYQRFKDKNFTVLGVSLDDDKAEWLKAIKDDGLVWTQASELKRWDSPIVNLYKLESIPASVLLDPEGKILVKNLRGAELEDFLAETFK